MFGKLSSAFATVEPFLSTCLVDESSRKTLQGIAHKLPGITRTLLECRLVNDQPQVDFSQSFLVDDRIRLQSFLSESQLEGDGWLGIRSFVDKWAEPEGLLASAIAGVWFEFDLDLQVGTGLPVPGVFLTLAPGLSEANQYESVMLALDQVIGSVLGPERSGSMVAGLANCVEKLPAGAAPSYVGIMASRNPSSVRAQLGRIQPQQIEGYLRSVGLAKLPEHLQFAIELAFRHFDAAVLCIDLLPEISDRVGLEVFPSVGNGEAEILAFTEELVSNGMCSGEKRDGLLAWPGRLDPTNCKGAWPDHLIWESLTKQPNEFSVMDRRINHFKLVCAADRPVEAKAYLAIDHLWARFDEVNQSAKEE